MRDSNYWDLHARGLQSLEEARFDAAREAFSAAQREAESQGLADLADRAYCNGVAIQLELDPQAPVSDGLSRILGNSSDSKARQLAAYYLGCSHSNRGTFAAARLYGEMAVRLAESMDDPRGAASGLNLLGVLLLEEGRLTPASECLRRSLEISTRADAQSYALLTTSTLAYCLSLRGSFSESLWMLEEALAGVEERSSRVYEPCIRLNLGFSYLEWGELEEAIEQGKAALEAVERRGMSSDTRFAYYLLGESFAESGALRQAEEHFDFLQKTWYPEHPDLTEVLLSIRTSRWLNWLGR